jgi:hypothetical protein
VVMSAAPACVRLRQHRNFLTRDQDTGCKDLRFGVPSIGQVVNSVRVLDDHVTRGLKSRGSVLAMVQGDGAALDRDEPNSRGMIMKSGLPTHRYVTFERHDVPHVTGF